MCSIVSFMTVFLSQMEVKDVEELISVGEEVEACPYYGSRYAVPKAEVSTTDGCVAQRHNCCLLSIIAIVLFVHVT